MSFLSCKKDKLSPGPWVEDIKAHPDKVYKFQVGDIECELKRQPGWNWNGYVTLPSFHPYFSKTYDEISEEFQVHGDLTYGSGDGTFGFDTAHELAGDLVPAVLVYRSDPTIGTMFTSMSFTPAEHFWTFEETKREVTQLAQQFAAKSS